MSTKRNFTKHQLNIKHNLQKSTGKLVLEIWTIKKKILQQELKATSKRLKYQKRLSARRTLNKGFAMNPKSMCRKMKGNKRSAKKIAPEGRCWMLLERTMVEKSDT